ncbi:MAG TPA: hypothetical protein PK199_02510 [Bacteroidales bacterium]|nr:hypothetical protein [Bacteroidales bacterium]
MKPIYPKAILIIITFFTFSTLLYSQSAVAPFGDGTSGNPYQIASLDNLYWISQNSSSWSSFFVQTNDINASATSTYDDGQGWTPIGNDVTKFSGSYDGDNYIITNLYIDRPTTNNVGLFGHITNGAKILNVGLIDVNIQGARGAGSLVGRVTGNDETVIQYCFVDGGTVVGDGATGGLVGSNNSSSLESALNSNNPALKPKISSCFAKVDVSWSQNFANYNNYDDDADWTNNDNYADKFGGLTGCNQKGFIENSFSMGRVTVNNNETMVAPDPINDKKYERIGGIAGCTYYKGDIVNSYSSTILVTSNVNRVGGFVGYKNSDASAGYISQSFWDTEISTLASSDGGVGKTTAEMKTAATYSDPTWDMATTWGISAGVNDGYPFLYNDNSYLLPIELISFEGNKVSDETIELVWKTASEQNNEGFEIQKSYNGTDFHTIAWVGGNGNSITEQQYSFVDFETSQDIVYYRLQQFDSDGESSYSEIISIHTSLIKEEIQFLQKQTVLSNAEIGQTYTIVIIKESGKTIYSHSCIAQSETFYCPYILEQGLYIVKIQKNSIDLITETILIEAN